MTNDKRGSFERCSLLENVPITTTANATDKPTPAPAARELIVVWDSKERVHVEIPKLFANQLLAEQYGPPFKVIEYSAYESAVRERDELRKDHWRSDYTAACIRADQAEGDRADLAAQVERLRSALRGLLMWAEANHETPNYSEYIYLAREALK